MRSPSTNTVQAPHAPWLHPFFEPKSRKWSRKKSSSDTRTSIGSWAAEPLTLMDMMLTFSLWQN
jgi:hypothetical protein